ncbi:hypothetical protein RRG08_036497 [Elysia crispata]|uniref:Uncharacterized protein n=1 Tax=Elysia crispata TaxID=231223 RepID=A0AAE0ZKF0_9GAST|nr:hypothetical protein RRG08_036497 [Elysia crispata]
MCASHKPGTPSLGLDPQACIVFMSYNCLHSDKRCWTVARWELIKKPNRQVYSAKERLEETKRTDRTWASGWAWLAELINLINGSRSRGLPLAPENMGGCQEKLTAGEDLEGRSIM